jgi:hypothetical protein
LSDPRVVALISKNFVPVAVNLYELRSGESEEGKLFEAIHKQKQQWQGLWVVAPDGKVLNSYQDIKNLDRFSEEVLAALETAARKFGPIAPRNFKWVDPLPYRGRGVQPDGKITLAIYIRDLKNGIPVGPGVVDSLTLSVEEMQAYAPGEAVMDHTWTVNPEVAKKLCRALSPDHDLVTMPLPREVTNMKLTGRVNSVGDDEVTLTYFGEIAMKHYHRIHKDKFNHGWAKIEGTATYDTKRKQFLSVTLILVGEFYNFQPYHENGHPIVGGIQWKMTR